jgi:hypothetical protein
MLEPTPLTRDQFQEAVLERDHHACVLCARPASVVHHLVESRLWPDGGDYLENGATLCDEHHAACESTEISVEEVRAAAGITRVVLPPHLYQDQVYDKWGNPVLADGRRLRGELFHDEDVQRRLQHVLGLFTHWVKYPRTYHLPWSEGRTDDDRVLPSLDGLNGQEVVVTVKMDGENSTLYADYLHARSVHNTSHPARDWLKGFWARIAYEIPEGWRICGENLYARHSIHYRDLPSYFMGFSVWNDRNICLSWDDTLEYFGLLGIEPVPLLYRGPFDPDRIRGLWSDEQWASMEGYVVRVAESFPYGEFRHRVGKFVRRRHVRTDRHWMHGQPVVPNELRGE